MWHHRVQSTPDSEAMTFKVDGVWTTIDWAEAGERVRSISNGLLGLGLDPEQRVAILADTRVEWILADIGTLCAGGATTTIYPSNTPEECRYILNDCDAVAIFCDSDAQVAKILEVRETLPSLQHIIVFDGTPDAERGVMTLAELQAAGQRHGEAHPEASEASARATTPVS